MRPERWQQIEKLHHPALKQEASRRTAFLKEACAGAQEQVHRKGVVRDPKPRNIILKETGAMLQDFELAKQSGGTRAL